MGSKNFSKAGTPRESMKINSLIDRKVHMAANKPYPAYFTDSQLEHVKEKYPYLIFTEVQTEYPLPKGQKAYAVRGSQDED